MEEKLQRRLLLIRIDRSRVHERSCLPFTLKKHNFFFKGMGFTPYAQNNYTFRFSPTSKTF